MCVCVCVCVCMCACVRAWEVSSIVIPYSTSDSWPTFAKCPPENGCSKLEAVHLLAARMLLRMSTCGCWIVTQRASVYALLCASAESEILKVSRIDISCIKFDSSLTLENICLRNSQNFWEVSPILISCITFDVYLGRHPVEILSTGRQNFWDRTSISATEFLRQKIEDRISHKSACYQSSVLGFRFYVHDYFRVLLLGWSKARAQLNTYKWRAMK